MGPSIPIHEAEEDDDYPPRWQDDGTPPRRRRAGGWLVALVMLAAVGFLSFALERRYRFIESVAGRMPRQAATDPRLETFVAEGEHALSRGDLDTAQGAFDRAGVLAERDPRVLLGEARVAVAKADIPWLKLRLLPADSADELRATTSLLMEQAAAARSAADAALAAAPQDPRAIGTKLDTLRVAGDVDAARGYVLAIFGQASAPETAYVLGALDLAQVPPQGHALGAAVDRLRVAAAVETRPGRAEAALVYALVRAGDTAAARVELAKMDASARPYPLLPSLHAWLGAVPGAATPSPSSVPAASASAVAIASAASAQPSTAPAAVAGANAPVGEATHSAGAGESSALQVAMDAMRRGDFDHAERVYQAMLVSNPRDSQALGGLGDVLRMRHDPHGAIDAYKRALGVNPSYLPASIGLADTQWAEGDRSAAARSYKNIVDHFPDGTYPAYINQRAAGGS